MAFGEARRKFEAWGDHLLPGFVDRAQPLRIAPDGSEGKNAKRTRLDGVRKSWTIRVFDEATTPTSGAEFELELAPLES